MSATAMDATRRPTPAHVTQPTKGAGALRSSVIFTARSMRLSMRDVESVLMAVLLPVMLMLMFTFVFGGAINVGGPGEHAAYLRYVLPGIVLTCAGFGASFTGVSVSQDMTTGTINRLRTMPIASATVLAGHTVASLVRNLWATAIVVVVAVAIGFRSPASVGQWALAALLIAAWILAITTVFAMLGLLAESPQAASGYGFILLFLPYVSSAFAPVESMPSWLQGFATHQPVTPIVEAVRSLLLGEAPGSQAMIGLAWSAGLTVLAFALIVRIFPRRVAR